MPVLDISQFDQGPIEMLCPENFSPIARPRKTLSAFKASNCEMHFTILSQFRLVRYFMRS